MEEEEKFTESTEVDEIKIPTIREVSMDDHYSIIEKSTEELNRNKPWRLVIKRKIVDV